MAMTSRAASGVLTVMRTISEPASASSFTWIAVAMGSAVSVFVMDCTTTGACPPMWTACSPHFTATERVGRRDAAPTSAGGASWQGEDNSCMRILIYGFLPDSQEGSQSADSQPCQSA